MSPLVLHTLVDIVWSFSLQSAYCVATAGHHDDAGDDLQFVSALANSAYVCSSCCASHWAGMIALSHAFIGIVCRLSCMRTGIGKATAFVSAFRLWCKFTWATGTASCCTCEIFKIMASSRKQRCHCFLQDLSHYNSALQAHIFNAICKHTQVRCFKTA